MDMLEILNVKH